MHAGYRPSIFSMLAFQKYQLEFTAHIRNPNANKKPAKVKDARMAVYREIVFNNIFGSVSACFPVCKSILGARAWRKLVREFFAHHQAQTPIFREIPQQFLQFLKTSKQLPNYLEQLAHYEWVELAVGSQPTTPIKLSKKIGLLKETPVLAPAHMLLEYDFAVHKVSKKYLPKTTQKTNLLVFRNTENAVKFIELNSMTFQLLKLIDENGMAGGQALERLAEDMNYPDKDAIIQFGAQILADLVKQDAIIGSY
jgi:hypothetical protein